MAAGYDIYTLLDTLIDRAAWPSESERVAAHDSVQQYREVALFGNMAAIIACTHPNAGIRTVQSIGVPTSAYSGSDRVYNRNGQRYCPDCGRMLT